MTIQEKARQAARQAFDGAETFDEFDMIADAVAVAVLMAVRNELIAMDDRVTRGDLSVPEQELRVEALLMEFLNAAEVPQPIPARVLDAYQALRTYMLASVSVRVQRSRAKGWKMQIAPLYKFVETLQKELNELADSQPRPKA